MKNHVFGKMGSTRSLCGPSTGSTTCWTACIGKYEAAFREIDETVLPNPTAEDLKDLGVSIVGHRRKLLDAFAALHNDTVKTPSADAAAPPSATIGD